MYKLYLPVVILCCCTVFVSAQSTEKKKLSKLSFMIGDWSGTSTSYKKDTTVTNPVRENVVYEMDGALLVLRLKSPTLQLHTLVQYSKKDSCYYYLPTTPNSTGKYKGEMVDGKFMVWFNDARRLVFEKYKESGFREYGQSFKDGKWTTYFEDILLPSESLRLETSQVKKEYRGVHEAFSDAVTVTGHTKQIYIAGQVGSGSTMEEQFETAYRAVEKRLEESGATFSDVVKMNIYIAGYQPERDLPVFFEVRKRLYGNGKMPPNVFIGVSSLFNKKHKVEMDAIAVR